MLVIVHSQTLTILDIFCDRGTRTDDFTFCGIEEAAKDDVLVRSFDVTSGVSVYDANPAVCEWEIIDKADFSVLGPQFHE